LSIGRRGLAAIPIHGTQRGAGSNPPGKMQRVEWLTYPRTLRQATWRDRRDGLCVTTTRHTGVTAPCLCVPGVTDSAQPFKKTRPPEQRAELEESTGKEIKVIWDCDALAPAVVLD
jgi:hypothetical protein